MLYSPNKELSFDLLGAERSILLRGDEQGRANKLMSKRLPLETKEHITD